MNKKEHKSLLYNYFTIFAFFCVVVLSATMLFTRLGLQKYENVLIADFIGLVMILPLSVERGYFILGREGKINSFFRITISVLVGIASFFVFVRTNHSLISESKKYAEYTDFFRIECKLIFYMIFFGMSISVFVINLLSRIFIKNKSGQKKESDK